MPNRNEPVTAGFAAVMLLALAATAVGCTGTGASTSSGSNARQATSSPSRPMFGAVTDLLATQSDFPPIGDHQYSQGDSADSFIPTRSGPIDACDRLMWPEKEFPDVVHPSASCDPPPEHGGGR